MDEQKDGALLEATIWQALKDGGQDDTVRERRRALKNLVQSLGDAQTIQQPFRGRLRRRSPHGGCDGLGDL